MMPAYFFLFYEHLANLHTHLTQFTTILTILKLLDLHALCSHPVLVRGQLLDPHLGIVQFLVAES